jgi:hypothetical protein
MRGYSSMFRVHKEGSQPHSYEDAAGVLPSPTDDGELVTRRLRAAVADGASEAMLASKWAQLLVRNFLEGPILCDLLGAISHSIQDWESVIAEHLAEREAIGRPIEWYEEPGLERGSYATLLGVRFLDGSRAGEESSGVFDAWAIGDSCFFQVREERLISSFPMKRADDFGTSPVLVPSKPQDLDVIREHIQHLRGDWRFGDSCYLMTDALAHWFMRLVESDCRPWEVLRDLGTDAATGDFGDWISHERRLGNIKNDDTTLLRLDIS